MHSAQHYQDCCSLGARLTIIDEGPATQALLLSSQREEEAPVHAADAAAAEQESRVGHQLGDRRVGVLPPSLHPRGVRAENDQLRVLGMVAALGASELLGCDAMAHRYEYISLIWPVENCESP